MGHQHDIISAAFFACCALLMATLAKWPSLWVAISVNRNATREQLTQSASKLRPLALAACVACILMAIVTFYDPPR